MSATLTDTALFATIIIAAIALLILLFVVVFNCSRPGIYLDDNQDIITRLRADSDAINITVPMNQVEEPQTKQASRPTLLPF
ncbi:hypothetical protein VKS41_002546 [Umbelopsis sp. WA50703]|jgi:hypothetical protein